MDYLHLRGPWILAGGEGKRIFRYLPRRRRAVVIAAGSSLRSFRSLVPSPAMSAPCCSTFVSSGTGYIVPVHAELTRPFLLRTAPARCRRLLPLPGAGNTVGLA
jgi:hypothetical protein